MNDLFVLTKSGTSYKENSTIDLIANFIRLLHLDYYMTSSFPGKIPGRRILKQQFEGCYLNEFLLLN